MYPIPNLCTKVGFFYMHNIALDILPIALIAIFVSGMYPCERSDINADYLSIETGNSFRGLFAIVVVFHHLSQRTSTGLLFRYFTEVGYLAVAVFFFFSGYGLQKSYITKGINYRKGFLFRRLPSVLAPYIIATALYWFQNFRRGVSYSTKDIITMAVTDHPIVSFSWFIINILAFYVAFWLLMFICRKHYLLMIFGAVLFNVCWVAYCIKMNLGIWWYRSSHLLVIGMFWAIYEEDILDEIKASYRVIVPITWSAFAVLFFFQEQILSLFPILNLQYSLITAVVFVMSVLLFSMKIQIGNKVLAFLCNISLEIYLLHGLFISGLTDKTSELLWCVSILAGTIISAYILHTVSIKTAKKYTSILHKAGIC